MERNMYGILFVLLTQIPSLFCLNCLVIRPGKGLMSEKCPEKAVGCRIRVEGDAIQWYEYSRLYDRNQLVCVLKHEYHGAQKSGCSRRKSGSIRCWCYGQSNCNNPEVSKLLYQTYLSGDKYEFDRVVDEIDTSDQPDYESIEEEEIKPLPMRGNVDTNKANSEHSKGFNPSEKSGQVSKHHITHGVRGGGRVEKGEQHSKNFHNLDDQVTSMKFGNVAINSTQVQMKDIMSAESTTESNIYRKGMKSNKKSRDEQSFVSANDLSKHLRPEITLGKGMKMASKHEKTEVNFGNKISKADEEDLLNISDFDDSLINDPTVTAEEFQELLSSPGGNPYPLPTEFPMHEITDYDETSNSKKLSKQKKSSGGTSNKSTRLQFLLAQFIFTCSSIIILLVI